MERYPGYLFRTYIADPKKQACDRSPPAPQRRCRAASTAVSAVVRCRVRACSGFSGWFWFVDSRWRWRWGARHTLSVVATGAGRALAAASPTASVV
eukprot:6039325-Pleurochrysis_carterae.AAC.2